MSSTLFPLRRGAFQLLLICIYLLHFTTGFEVLFSSTLPQIPGKFQEPEQARSKVGLEQQRKDRAATTSDYSYREVSEHWAGGKNALRDPKCCVVSIFPPGSSNDSSENGLRALQYTLADHGPTDIDIRARINTTTIDSAYQDCSKVWDSIFVSEDKDVSDDSRTYKLSSAAIDSLTKLARGVSSFEETIEKSSNSPLRRRETAVYMRIVCASSYRAHDPVFHTDKAPLRGYITLRGVGTEFVTHPCSPLEYVGLRTLGQAPSKEGSLRCAEELEFIVMKGDYYYEYFQETAKTPPGGGWWQREFACVHRSPPGGGRNGEEQGRRRVIVSFDLADGDDDREWHDVGQKRQWRSGMTQRKSHLVA
mmetsp:Transcript_15912/g.36691  ORF Transcript_15912/g.36691 Transcript_15912/m.36691 type:complete len:364 (+) Transcript_15912:65-1156(+)